MVLLVRGTEDPSLLSCSCRKRRASAQPRESIREVQMGGRPTGGLAIKVMRNRDGQELSQIGGG